MKSKNSFGIRTVAGVGLGVGLGVGVGTAIGLATDKLVMSVGIGVVIGVGIVLTIAAGIRSKYNKSKSKKFDKDGYLKK